MRGPQWWHGFNGGKHLAGISAAHCQRETRRNPNASVSPTSKKDHECFVLGMLLWTTSLPSGGANATRNMAPRDMLHVGKCPSWPVATTTTVGEKHLMTHLEPTKEPRPTIKPSGPFSTLKTWLKIWPPFGCLIAEQTTRIKKPLTNLTWFWEILLTSGQNFMHPRSQTGTHTACFWVDGCTSGKPSNSWNKCGKF